MIRYEDGMWLKEEIGLGEYWEEGDSRANILEQNVLVHQEDSRAVCVIGIVAKFLFMFHLWFLKQSHIPKAVFELLM